MNTTEQNTSRSNTSSTLDSVSDRSKLLWLLSSLWQPTAHTNISLQIPMLDTIVLFGDGSMRWYFTAKNGLLMKRHEHRLVWDEIQRAFTKAHRKHRAPDWNDNGDKKYIAISRRLPGGYLPMRSRMLDPLQLKAMFSNKRHHHDLIALQVYVHPRGQKGCGVFLSVYEAFEDGEQHLETYELQETTQSASKMMSSGGLQGLLTQGPGSPDQSLGIDPSLATEDEGELVPGSPSHIRRSFVEMGQEARVMREQIMKQVNHPYVPDNAVRHHGTCHRIISGYMRRLIRHIEFHTGRELRLLLAEFVQTQSNGIHFAIVHQIELMDRGFLNFSSGQQAKAALSGLKTKPSHSHSLYPNQVVEETLDKKGPNDFLSEEEVPSYMKPTEANLLHKYGARGIYGSTGVANPINLHNYQMERSDTQRQLQQETEKMFPKQPEHQSKPRTSPIQFEDENGSPDSTTHYDGQSPSPEMRYNRVQSAPTQAGLLQEAFKNRVGRVSGHELQAHNTAPAPSRPNGDSPKRTRPKSAPLRKAGQIGTQRLPSGSSNAESDGPQSARSHPTTSLQRIHEERAASPFQEDYNGHRGGFGSRPPSKVGQWTSGQPGGAGGKMGCHGEYCEMYLSPGATAWPNQTSNWKVTFKSILLARAEDKFLGTSLIESLAMVPQLEDCDVVSILGQVVSLRLQMIMDKCRELAIRVWQNDNSETGGKKLDLGVVEDMQRQLLYSSALGHLHPSRFYHTVSVCRNCYTAYQIVDKQRAKFPLLLNVSAAKVGGKTGKSHAIIDKDQWQIRRRGEGSNGGEKERRTSKSADIERRQTTSASSLMRVMSETKAFASRRRAVAESRANSSKRDDSQSSPTLAKKNPKKPARRANSSPTPASNTDRADSNPRKEYQPGRREQKQSMDRLSQAGTWQSYKPMNETSKAADPIYSAYTNNRKSTSPSEALRESTYPFEDMLEDIDKEFAEKPPLLPLDQPKYNAASKRSLFPLLPRVPVAGTRYAGI